MMTSSGSATEMGRSDEISGLQKLRSPEEGGVKKEYDDFMEKIENHVAIKWPQGSDIAYFVKNGEDPDMDPPKDLTEDEQKQMLKMRKWEIQAAIFFQRESILCENKKALYTVIYSNLTSTTKSRVEQNKSFPEKHRASDLLWIMSVIDDIMTDFDVAKPYMVSVHQQLRRVMTITQQRDETNDGFVRRLVKEIKLYEKRGGALMYGHEHREKADMSLKEIQAKYEVDNGSKMSDEESTKAKKIIVAGIQEKIRATTVFLAADEERYGDLRREVANAFLTGRDDYPKTIPEVLKMLNNYQRPSVSFSDSHQRPGNRHPQRKMRGRMFAQSESPATNYGLWGKNADSFYAKVHCHMCGIPGHYKANCPVVVNDDGSNLPTRTKMHLVADEEVSTRQVHGIFLNQHDETHINPNLVLLDSASSHHLFHNEKLLTNVGPTTNGEVLNMSSNGGSFQTIHKGKFGPISVWVNPNCLANVLSLALVSDEYRVTMDTEVEDAIFVHISERHRMKFIRVAHDLYACDVSELTYSKLENAFSFLNTVSDNKRMYSIRDVRKADEAIALNRRINHAASEKFERILKDNLILNCPLTVGDARRSQKIYGPPLPPIKGRTRYQQPARITDPTIIPIPLSMYEELKNVTLCIDFHYVNGVTVFHSISRRISYRTVSFPLSRSKAAMVSEIKNVCKKYHSRGFRVVEIHADNEFETVADDILPARLVCCGTDEHIPEIERSIQTQKNENRSLCHSMPYNTIPRIMVREIIKQGNSFLNAFGNAENLANGLTPRNIIDNLPHVDYNDLKYEFGEYVQIHLEQSRTNTMAARTVGAIVMGPRDLRGRYNFMSLETGNAINGRVVARMPITDEVITRVEYLGRKQGQQYGNSKMLRYEWRPGKEITDENDYQHDFNTSPNHAAVILPDPVFDAELEMEEKDSHSDIECEMKGKTQEEEMIVTQGAQNETLATQGAQDEIQNGDQGAFMETNVESSRNLNQENNENLGPQKKIEEVVDDQANVDETLTEGEDTVEPSDDIGGDQTQEIRNKEKERRSKYFEVNIGDEYGKGKRKKIKKKNFSFLQTNFKDLDDNGKTEYFRHAWREYKISGSTSLLESFTSGFIFAQMSAKAGLKKYGEDAKICLIAEFKQLMDYDVFHGRNASELTCHQKQKAANMINLIEEKINRGHTEKIQ